MLAKPFDLEINFTGELMKTYSKQISTCAKLLFHFPFHVHPPALQMCSLLITKVCIVLVTTYSLT